ncbi:hypothetical protein O1611_g10141 [Lasiodiplodia mahajangana]|uniref:Uncharacterized protein n=1 Tax=Lasiodiplodia mahajangana TaxID=1108764 RepID=A0ACC2J1D5_9PEZI|nr:hypothetical protein O1611_g10141 [Lasiodiplodia mahajangana]
MRFDPHPHDKGRDPGKSLSRELLAANTTDIVGLNTPPGREKANVNNDSDLDTICETTNTLLVLVAEIPAKTFPDDVSKYVAEGIRTRCLTLRSHLNRLQEILHGYAKHRRLGSRLAELPVGVSEWLENLKAELLALQNNVLRAQEPRYPYCTSTSPVSQHDPCRGHYKNLSGFCSQMDGLMAVIQIDYEDFHTLHMPTLLVSEGDARMNYRGHPRSFGPIASGNRQLVHIRRELYSLKDQIVTCLGEIHSCEHHGISNSSDERKTMTTLTLSYKKTKESLEEMLSNHTGDWMDHSIAGGLTYQEFCRINADTIRSLTFQLKDVTDDMFLERTRAQSLRFKNSPKTLSRNEGLITISPVIISTLRTTEEVLASILQLRKSV